MISFATGTDQFDHSGHSCQLREVKRAARDVPVAFRSRFSNVGAAFALEIKIEMQPSQEFRSPSESKLEKRPRIPSQGGELKATGRDVPVAFESCFGDGEAHRTHTRYDDRSVLVRIEFMQNESLPFIPARYREPLPMAW